MKITCNRCQANFGEADQPRFAGRMAARLSEFLTCPGCGQTDHHWLYARDAAPTFTGTARERDRAFRRWLSEN